MTIFGWDLSHYDAPTIGDAVSEGYSFFTHKAGGDANDAEIGTWWSSVKGQRGKALIGAYWVLYPGNGAGRADAFLARLDSQCPGWRDGPFILQLDCEKWGGDPSTVPSKADIKAACDRLKARMPKLTPIVYAPKWVYENSLSGLTYPIWASNYSSASSGTGSGIYAGIGGDSSSRWAAYGGQTPAILQFTSSATIAGQTTCDANAYRGTLAELTHLLSPGWITEEDMALDDTDATLVAKKTLQIDGVVKAPPGSLNADGTPNEYWSPATHAYWNYMETVHGRDYAKAAADNTAALAAQVSALQSAVAALAARPAATVDIPALAAALAPQISGVTEDEMKALLENIDIKITPGA